jgi:hypothetical protein
MPAGLVDKKGGVRAWRNLRCDFGEVEIHRLRVAAWHDKRRALAVLGTNRAEDIGGGGSLIFGSAWTRAALGPTPGDLVLLADARLVGEPDLYRAGLDALFAPERFQSPCDQAIANAAGGGVVKELQSLRQSCTAAELRG